MLNKKLKILIVILVLAAVGAGASFLGTQNIKLNGQPMTESSNISRDQTFENNEGNSTEDLIPVSDEKSEVITSDVDTSDWRIYRNEELGFEFRYPEEWKYLREGKNFVNLNPSDKEPIHSPRVKIRIWSNPENVGLKDFYNNLENYKKISGNDGLIYNWYELSQKTKDIFVDNKKAINFIQPIGIVENTTVAIPVNRKIIEINFYFIGEILSGSVEGHIIDSLKFIDNSSTE